MVDGAVDAIYNMAALYVAVCFYSNLRRYVLLTGAPHKYTPQHITTNDTLHLFLKIMSYRCRLVTLLLTLYAPNLVQSLKIVNVVTGANGFIGRAIVNELTQKGSDNQQSTNLKKLNGAPPNIYPLVRSRRVESEQSWVDTLPSNNPIKVHPYDMLDSGTSLADCLSSIMSDHCGKEIAVNIFHVASVFGPTEDHEQTALDNVKGTEDVIRTCAAHECKINCVIVTSSMAAVRATNQTPLNGVAYTHEDWNTMSKLGANWGASYQWSKMQSEKRARELSAELNVNLVSICPSFVFGPMLGPSSSYSLELVGKWARGQADVQSRLCADVRDVARAHVFAATQVDEVLAGDHDSSSTQQHMYRYIVSSEARLTSLETAEALRRAARATGVTYGDKITCDLEFDGGAIQIGEQEVICADRLRDELDLVCRPVVKTMEDMARTIYMEEVRAKIAQMEVEDV